MNDLGFKGNQENDEQKQSMMKYNKLSQSEPGKSKFCTEIDEENDEIRDIDIDEENKEGG